MPTDVKVRVATWGPGHKLMLRWTDPDTGERRAETSGTDDPEEAAKKAGVLEQQLRDGSYVPSMQRRRRKATPLTWEDFCLRHEQVVQPGLADKTGRIYRTVFGSVQRLTGIKRLTDLRAERLSAYTAALREQGRSEYTIKSYLAHLRAALGWAQEIGLLKTVPKFPKVVRARNGKAMKGRCLCEEEVEKMLLSVKSALTERPNKQRREPKAPSPEVVESWQYLLRGLWTGGFRLDEALHLSWDRRDRPCIDLTGKRPMLWIPGDCQKSGKDELYPLAPEFCQLVLATPPAQRRGRVFRPIGVRGKTGQLGMEYVSDAITRIGKQAGIAVSETTKRGADGKPRRVVKWASAHDLRRGFGDRWKDRVLPIVLQSMMRHEDLNTTLKYYTSRNAQNTAETIWGAFEEAVGKDCGQEPTGITTDPGPGKDANLAEQRA